MFFRRRRNENRFLNIQDCDDRFATNSHGLQMFNGPNHIKACKTMVVLASGFVISFGASVVLFDKPLSALFGALILSVITTSILAQYARALGEQRRTGSNFMTHAAISWGLMTNNLTQQQAEHIASSNTYYNFFNGGAKIFDDITPPFLRNCFESSI